MIADVTDRFLRREHLRRQLAALEPSPFCHQPAALAEHEADGRPLHLACLRLAAHDGACMGQDVFGAMEPQERDAFLAEEERGQRAIAGLAEAMAGW